MQGEILWHDCHLKVNGYSFMGKQGWSPGSGNVLGNFHEMKLFHEMSWMRS